MTWLVRTYPGGQVRATRLGNALVAMEERAGREYGWDAVVTWPRLYPVLPEQFRATVDERRDLLDMSTRFAVTAATSALVCGVLLIGSGWWPMLASAPLAVAVLAYRSALSAALSYGETVTTAFDLYRFDLLSVLHMPLQQDAAAERTMVTAICDQWRQGLRMDHPYQHDVGDR